MKPIPSPMSRHALDLMNKAQELSERIDVLSKAKCPDCGNTKMGCTKMGGCGSKDDKMKGNGVFTIGDAQRRNAGYPSEPAEESDYSEEEGDLDDYEEANREQASPPPMREDAGAARTLPLSEGKPREQKRGEAGRGVQVKRPGFRGPPMPLSDRSASGKTQAFADHMQSRKGVKKSESGAQPGFNTTFDTKPQDIAFVSESGGQTRNAYYSTNQHLLNSEDVANKGSTSVSVSLEKLASMLNPHEGGGASRLDDNGVFKNNPN